MTPPCSSGGYYILLRDVKHVETGVQQNTKVFLAAAFGGLMFAGGMMYYIVEMVKCGAAGACSMTAMCGLVMFIMMTGEWLYTKKATISIGVAPGGAVHSFGNPYGRCAAIPCPRYFLISSRGVSCASETERFFRPGSRQSGCTLRSSARILPGFSP